MLNESDDPCFQNRVRIGEFIAIDRPINRQIKSRKIVNTDDFFVNFRKKVKVRPKRQDFDEIGL